MKSEEFYALFPRADVRHFKEDIDNNVLYDANADVSPSDVLDDVSEIVFWQNKEAVKKLGLSTTDFSTYLLDPVGFLKLYKTFHHYGTKKKESFWKPQEWSFYPEQNPPEIILKTANINFENFRIYVSSNVFFVLNKKLKILNFDNINKIDFKDDKNLYCLALKSMYVLSYLGGMSLQNLQSENHLAKSLAYFYFYYHLNKFYNYRNFAQYNLEPLEKLELFQSLYHWLNHHVYYHKQIHYTEKELKRKKDDVVREIHRDGKWVRYQTKGSKRDLTKDYLKLINTMGNGLTKVGQILFQESCQAYVYAILGAQAKTRWKIVGEGANSYQTQNVFSTLVDEIIANNNLSSLIKSIRLAIQETKVRLDFCISPGLELLPSEMIYIKDSPGYNNILLLSNSSFKFGVNTSVNGNLKRLQQEVGKVGKDLPEVKKDLPEVAKNLPIEVKKDMPGVKPTTLVFGSFVSAVLLRLVWIAL